MGASIGLNLVTDSTVAEILGTVTGANDVTVSALTENAASTEAANRP